MRRLPLDELLAAIVAAVVLVLSFQRLGYSVYETDEAYYAVVAQRFALGDRPFIDEVNLRQTFGLLIAPIYWIYLKIAGNTDGVIHFLRGAFFALQVATGAAAYLLAARLARRAVAILVASVPVAFVPVVATLSYNTLAEHFFAIGLFLGLLRALDPGPWRTWLFAGACQGLATIAYPPLAPAVLATGVAALFVVPAARRRAAWLFFAGAAGAGLPFIAWCLPGVFTGIPKALAYERMFTQPRNFDKLTGIASGILAMLPSPAPFVAAGVLALLLHVFRRARGAVLAAVIVGTAIHFSNLAPGLAKLYPHWLSGGLVITFGLLFPLLALFDAERRALLVVAGVPSLLAGVLCAIASDNGAINAEFGLLAAAVLFLVVVARLVAPATAAGGLGLVAALAVAPMTLLHLNWRTSYDGVPIAKLTREVASGPFRGLRTTPDRAARIEDLGQAVRELAPPGERLLNYYDFPAAYLMSEVRPAVPTSWTDRRGKAEPLLEYYREHRSGRGIVVVTRGAKSIAPAMEALVEVPGRLLKDGGWYRIYREPPP